MLSGVQSALGQLSERVSLLEKEQSEGKCQRDDAEDALQAVDDFRIEFAVKLREKCELLSESESLAARLEALVARTARPPAPAMLELPDGHATVLVEMPVTPDADSTTRSLSKSDDPRSQLIIEVSESLDGDGCAAAAAEDVEKEYSISVPVTPMPAVPAAEEKVCDDRTREELVVMGVSPEQDERQANDHFHTEVSVPDVSEATDVTEATDVNEATDVAEATDVTDVTEVPLTGQVQIKSRDDFESSETTETTSAGEKESPLPSDREVSSSKKTVVGGHRSFLTEALSDDRSSSIPSDFRVPMMMVITKAEESGGGIDDLPIFKAVLEEGDVEFNVTTEEAEGLWKEPEEDLGLLDLDWEKDLIGDEDDDEPHNRVVETADGVADRASELEEAFQRLSPGMSDDDSAAEPQEANEPGDAAREETLQKHSPPVPDSSSHAQGTT